MRRRGENLPYFAAHFHTANFTVHTDNIWKEKRRRGREEERWEEMLFVLRCSGFGNPGGRRPGFQLVNIIYLGVSRVPHLKNMFHRMHLASH